MTGRALDSPRRRRGFGLIEMAVTGVLLVVMAAITMQVTAGVATSRRLAARREAATRLVAEVVEEARSLAWADLTTERIQPWSSERLASDANLVASGATLRVEVVPAAAVADRAARRIVVAVAWPDPARGAGAPIRLVAWAFEPASAGGQP